MESRDITKRGGMLISSKDKIPGGLASGKSKKDFDKDSLKEGTQVELEHTSDKDIASEIAMDHLTEDRQYYKKLKNMEKKEKCKKCGGKACKCEYKEVLQYPRVDEEEDGKRELDVGSEELEKTSLRWSELRKALNSDDAFLDIKKEGEEEEEQPPEEQPPEEQPPEEQPPEEGQEQPAPEGEEQPEGEVPMDQEEGEEDADPTQDEEAPPEDGGEEAPEGDEDPEEQIEALTQALKDEGHSDAEIAYIIHGHTVHNPDTDENSAQNEMMSGAQERGMKQRDSDLDHDTKRRDAEQDSSHKQRMSDMEAEHKQRMNDLEHQKAMSELADPETEKSHRSRMLDVEYENAQKETHASNMDNDHKQRMLDLEYEKAMKEMEMELENKKAEMQLKLRHAEEGAKHKMALQKEQHKHKAAEAKKSMAQDAAKTSEKEKKGK